MRALRVLGLADASDEEPVKNLICEDPATGEQFSVPCDDRLRAGARGDLSRLGQLEIEMESQLRPREIQARIRAGATVEQVAALACTTAARVERFAYPVLLERASIVEKALKARPAIDGITASVSVADTVAATLAARGHDSDVRWDAFKDDDGWVLSLTWSAGRSENRAQWLFHPGRDGGTLSARDEAAAEIVDPALRILRPLRPVRQTAVAPTLPDPTLPTERSAESASRSAHPAGGKLTPPATRPSTTSGDRPGSRSSRFGAPMQPQVLAGATASAGAAARMVEDTVTDERAGVNPMVTHDAVARTGTDSPMPALPGGQTRPRPSTPAAETGTTADPAPATAVAASSAGKARRGQRPAMPSWEDVLLGTKSTGR